MTPELFAGATPGEAGAAAAACVLRRAAEAVAARGRFAVALSGGSLPDLLGPALIRQARDGGADWRAWHVFWADERCVPPTSPESNFAPMHERLFRHAAIPPEHIYSLAAGHEPEQAARDYEARLRGFFAPPDNAPPRFDLIVLGMGEDGHTASLFPGHPLLEETRRWVAPIFDSPKPPPGRITLTLPVINAARHIVFVTAGAGKAAALAAVLGAHPQTPALPARRVAPVDGTVRWFVDAAAAKHLGEPHS